MKLHHYFGILLLSILWQSCDKDEITYPYVLEYQSLEFNNTQWYVLTANAQTPVNTPASVVGFDEVLLVDLISDFAAPVYNRLEFLSDTTVMIRFAEQGFSFDTILPYSVNQGITSIKIGPSPEEALLFYKGPGDNSLVSGVVSTYHSFKLPNGMVDYSPLTIDYTIERNPLIILNQLRMEENLMAGDTVGVNLSGYLFE